MDNHPEIWLPLGFTDSEHRERNNHNLYLIGRLKEGVTVSSAHIELNALIETWAARAGITPGIDHAGHVFLPLAKGRDGHNLQMTPLADQILGRVGRFDPGATGRYRTRAAHRLGQCGESAARARRDASS